MYKSHEVAVTNLLSKGRWGYNYHVISIYSHVNIHSPAGIDLTHPPMFYLILSTAVVVIVGMIQLNGAYSYAHYVYKNEIQKE